MINCTLILGFLIFQNERFRNRVVQATFSTPGIKAPDTEISDDELLETLKKIIDERTNSFQQIKELEQKLKSSDKNNKDYQKNLSDIKKAVQNAKVSLYIFLLAPQFTFNQSSMRKLLIIALLKT